MAKLNDFYYQHEGEKGWKSWREVCEYRREFGRTKITAKILVSDYHAPSNTGLQSDACPECRGLGYWVDTTALRVKCRACSGSGRAAKA